LAVRVRRGVDIAAPYGVEESHGPAVAAAEHDGVEELDASRPPRGARRDGRAAGSARTTDRHLERDRLEGKMWEVELASQQRAEVTQPVAYGPPVLSEIKSAGLDAWCRTDPDRDAAAVHLIRERGREVVAG